MNEAIAAYFSGEKNGGLVLAGVGIAMLITAVVLFPARLELRSLAITVGVWSLLQLGIGIGLFLKTDAQVGALQSQLATSKDAMTATELPRMEKVQKNFVVLEMVWVAMIVVGAVVAWRMKENSAVAGVALGILINASVLLAFDIVAERRGATYLAALKG
jgi:hypothetical protein